MNPSDKGKEAAINFMAKYITIELFTAVKHILREDIKEQLSKTPSGPQLAADAHRIEDKIKNNIDNFINKILNEKA